MQTDMNTFSLALALVLVTLVMTLVLIMAAWHSGSGQGLRHWALNAASRRSAVWISVSDP